jgi:hypothetical protein
MTTKNKILTATLTIIVLLFSIEANAGRYEYHPDCVRVFTGYYNYFGQPLFRDICY